MTTIEINGHTMLEDVCVSVTAESGRRDDAAVRLSVHVTSEGIILDSFDKDGNCTGTMAADYDGWEERLEDGEPLPHEPVGVLLTFPPAVNRVLDATLCTLEECHHAHLGEHYHPADSLEAFTPAFVEGVRFTVGQATQAPDDRPLLSEAFDYLMDHQDEGPVPNGWKSNALEALIERISERIR